MAGDYCAGPESLTMEEASRLRDALAEAIQAAEELRS